MSATELQDLGIDEVSGVDAPANQMPGWMVMKSEEGAAAEAEAQLATLYGAIGGAGALADAPEDVRKAAELLAGHCEKQLTSEDDEADTLISKMMRLFKRQERAVEDLEKASKGKPFGGKKASPFGSDGDGNDGDGNDGEDDGDEDDVKKAGDETRGTAGTAPADGTDDLYSNMEPDVIEKALEPLAQHVEDSIEKSLAPVAEDMETFREVIEKMMDRIERLEDTVVGSSQPYGQEAGEVQKGFTFQDAIVAAAAGSRVTLN